MICRCNFFFIISDAMRHKALAKVQVRRLIIYRKTQTKIYQKRILKKSHIQVSFTQRYSFSLKLIYGNNAHSFARSTDPQISQPYPMIKWFRFKSYIGIGKTIHFSIQGSRFKVLHHISRAPGTGLRWNLQSESIIEERTHHKDYLI